MQHMEAIVLALFGTTVISALPELQAIQTAVEAVYPETPVRIAFTSNQVRRIWHHRGSDPAYLAQHPNIPESVFSVQGILATIANLQDQGYDRLVVQSAHIAPAEEFHDLNAYVRALGSIRTMKPRWQPFQALALGRPLLGTYNPKHAYSEDIRLAAVALHSDLEMARAENAALVYMGHGNHFFPSGGLYLEFAAAMRALAPDVVTLIGTVEGFPDFSEVLEQLRRHQVQRVLLKPFLVVAGNHAITDLVGPQEDSWSSMLEKNGFAVQAIVRGLGPQIAPLFVQHIADAAAEAGMELR